MEGNSIKSLENLCKIFEMRIKLDKEKRLSTPNDIVDNYEKYSKKIDAIYNSEFEKNIRGLISPEVTLEKEETRLKRLISLLEDRLEKRNVLEDRFYNSTGSYIDSLQLIVSEDELNDKRERLECISRYLTTKNEMDEIENSIDKIRKSLEEVEKEKNDYVDKNKLMEEKLYSILMKCVKSDEYFNRINEDNYKKELTSVYDKVRENEETLEVTLDSVKSLIGSGSSDDYTSYVEDAEKSFYVWKNRETILKLYELVIDFLDDFDALVLKREKISDLLEDRKYTRSKLHVEEADELGIFESAVIDQREVLNREREVLDNIVNYVSRIKFKEERLEELKDIVNSYDILAILREYGIIESFEENEDTEVIDDSISEDEYALDDIINDTIDPYRIKEINDYPKTLNLGLAKLKAESVRENVNRKLNPKPRESIFDDFTKDVSLDSSSNDDKKEETSSDDLLVKWEEPITEEVDSSLDEVNLDDDSLPVWSSLDSDINKVDVPDNFDNSNVFWTPVGDSFLNNSFPDMNNTGFPNIN